MVLDENGEDKTVSEPGGSVLHSQGPSINSDHEPNELSTESINSIPWLMKPGGSVLHLQEPSINSYPEPNQLSTGL